MMGQLQLAPPATVPSRLATLAARGSLDAASLTNAGAALASASGLEQFDRRQPEHIILAGTIGLGVFDARQIEHRVIKL